MEEFIKAAAVQLGIGEDKIKSATGGLLGMIKEHAGEGLASDIMNKLPGASALVNESGGASGGGSVGGGMLGGLMSSASKMLGGNAGKGAVGHQIPVFAVRAFPHIGQKRVAVMPADEVHHRG